MKWSRFSHIMLAGAIALTACAGHPTVPLSPDKKAAADKDAAKKALEEYYQRQRAGASVPPAR